MADTQNVKVSFDIMLVEAGMLTNGLSPYATSMALAERIEAEQKQAGDAGEYQMTLQLSPFEAGLIFQGLAQAQSSVCDDLLARLHRAIIKVIDDLGITTGPGRGNDQPGGIIDDSQPQPIVDEPAASDPSQPAPEPSGEEQPAQEAQPEVSNEASAEDAANDYVDPANETGNGPSGDAAGDEAADADDNSDRGLE